MKVQTDCNEVCVQQKQKVDITPIQSLSSLVKKRFNAQLKKALRVFANSAKIMWGSTVYIIKWTWF